MTVTTKTRGFAMRGVAAVVALAVFGTSSLAFAQGKAPAKPPAAAGKAAAKPAAGPAAKGPDKKAAGAAFKKGKELFEKKDYKGAKESFLKADEILPAGTAQYYIGRCQEELGDPADAVKWYEKAQADTKLKEDLAKDAKSRADALKAKPAKVHVTSDPPGATILVDGKAITDKTPADVELAPGAHKITLQSAGKKDSEQSVDVVAFTGATVNATLEAAAPATPAEDPFAGKPPPAASPPAEAPPPAPAPAPVAKDMTWVWITGGAAIVALGVGTVFGLQAMSKKKDFDDNSIGGAHPDAAAARDARDAGTRNALISDMGFGIGITLAVTSAVLYFTHPDAEAKPAAAKAKSGTTVSFAPVASPQGGGAFFKIAF